MGPQLKVVERTRTATMLCAASGNPDPEITWFKDFLPIDPNASNGRIKQLRSGKSLVFSSALCALLNFATALPSIDVLALLQWEAVTQHVTGSFAKKKLSSI